jgi:hypothetical protein
VFRFKNEVFFGLTERFFGSVKTKIRKEKKREVLKKKGAF